MHRYLTDLDEFYVLLRWPGLLLRNLLSRYKCFTAFANIWSKCLSFFAFEHFSSCLSFLLDIHTMSFQNVFVFNIQVSLSIFQLGKINVSLPSVWFFENPTLSIEESYEQCIICNVSLTGQDFGVNCNQKKHVFIQIRSWTFYITWSILWSI